MNGSSIHKFEYIVMVLFGTLGGLGIAASFIAPSNSVIAFLVMTSLWGYLILTMAMAFLFFFALTYKNLKHKAGIGTFGIILAVPISFFLVAWGSFGLYSIYPDGEAGIFSYSRGVLFVMSVYLLAMNITWTEMD